MADRKLLSIPTGLQRHTRLLRHFVTPGPGGPLLLLWSIGFGSFLILGHSMLSLAWTGLIGLLGLWMMFSYQGNPKVWGQFLHSSLAEQTSWMTLTDRSLRETVEKSADVIIEAALRLYGLEKSLEDRSESSRMLTAACELFSLQVLLARDVEGLTQGLQFIDLAENQVGTDLVTEAPAIRQETLDAIQKQASRGKLLIGEMSQQLETLLLKIVQLETHLDIRDGAAEIAREMETIVARSRAKVNTLHQSGTMESIRFVPNDLRPVRESLQRGFSRHNSSVGLKALQHLEYEFEQIQVLLQNRNEVDPLSIAQIPYLAEETYRQGLGVLKDVLGLLESVHSSDRGRLVAEVSQLEAEIASLKGEGHKETLVGMKEDTLASHRERLELLDLQESHVDELVHQCGRCEASLHRTRLQVSELKAGGSEVSIGAVTETLRQAINQAKEVQEELRMLGY